MPHETTMIDLLTIPGLGTSTELDDVRKKISKRMQYTLEHPAWECKPITSPEEYQKAVKEQGYSIRPDCIPQYKCIIDQNNTEHSVNGDNQATEKKS